MCFVLHRGADGVWDIGKEFLIGETVYNVPEHKHKSVPSYAFTWSYRRQGVASVKTFLRGWRTAFIRICILST